VDSNQEKNFERDFSNLDHHHGGVFYSGTGSKHTLADRLCHRSGSGQCILFGVSVSRWVYVLALVAAVHALYTGALESMSSALIITALAVFLEGFENGSS
jgi:hypothetical protein